ncbi:MAG: glycosyltransferase [Nitrososphaeria archaeon]
MSERSKNCITLLFSGNITRSRLAHIIKFLEILSFWMLCINIIVTRIEKEALKDFYTYSRKLSSDKPQIKFMVLDTTLNSTKKSLLRDTVISITRLPKIRALLKCDTLIVAGTINLANILIPRIIQPKNKIMVFAGGFSYMGVYISSFKNAIKRCFIYLIEFMHVLLSNYLLIEAPTMKNYIPVSKLVNIIFKNKIVDYANLHVEDFFFQGCEDLEARPYDLGYVGVLEERRCIKELMLLIKYLPKLIGKKVKVLIIGDGPLKYVLDNSVEKTMNQETLFIDYILPVPHFKLKDYYRKIKFLVFFTKSDGVPNTIIEAMASCCIIISTPVGGIPSVIDNNVTGFIVHGENIVLRTLQLLKILLCNNEIIREIGILARQQVLRSFSKIPVQIKWKHILNMSSRM